MGARGTAVVCAAFDPVLDGAVRARLAVLAAAGVPVRRQPRHPPHLTLGAVGPSVPTSQVLEAVAELAGGITAFPLALDHLGVFPRGGVLWLGPAPGPALTALHGAVDGALSAAGWPRAFGDRTAPGTWVAHCTLATRLPPDDLARAAAVLAREQEPLVGQVVALVTILVGGQGEVGHARLGTPSPSND